MSRCHHLINDKQHGFLRGKSCTTQMVPFANDLSLALNDSTRTDVVYFDFSKAFDSVNHDIVLYKLKNNFKINGLLLKLFTDYLRDRRQCVVIGGSKSAYRTVASGVPQGSILGPLLFVLFINDMHENINPGTKMALYADDTKIYREIKCYNDHVILQQDIDALFQWSLVNKMAFNPQKCKVLPVTLGSPFYWQVSLPFLEKFPYCLGDVCLDHVDYEKDLGVIVTGRLSWTKQCETLRSRASSRLGLLRRTCHFVKNPQQRRVLYLALVRSQFEHCSVVWGPSSNTIFARLESIQRRAVRWILSEPYRNYDELSYLTKLRTLDLLPIEFKFVHTDLSLFHKIIHRFVNIQLPYYLRQITPDDLTRLRSDHRDTAQIICDCEERLDVLKNSYFNRTYIYWNSLPLDLRQEENVNEFQDKLKEYLWLMLLEEFNSDGSTSLSSFFCESDSE